MNLKKYLVYMAMLFISGILVYKTFAQNNIVALNKNNAGYQLLSVDQFQQKLTGAANAQIVDTRLPEEYAINHLVNAININAKQDDYAKKIEVLNKTAPIFLYAIGNGRSEQLAKELTGKGYTALYVLDGGIGGWIGNGKPIYSSVKDNFSFNDFKKIVADNKLVLLDLHTRYCPACRKLQPVVDSLSNQYGTGLKTVKVDVYDNPSIAGNFKADAIPTLIVYNNGKVIWRKTGGDIQKTDVENILNGLIVK